MNQNNVNDKEYVILRSTTTQVVDKIEVKKLDIIKLDKSSDGTITARKPNQLDAPLIDPDKLIPANKSLE